MDSGESSTEDRDSGQSSKFSVVRPTNIEGLSIKQRLCVLNWLLVTETAFISHGGGSQI